MFRQIGIIQLAAQMRATSGTTTLMEAQGMLIISIQKDTECMSYLGRPTESQTCNGRMIFSSSCLILSWQTCLEILTSMSIWNLKWTALLSLADFPFENRATGTMPTASEKRLNFRNVLSRSERLAISLLERTRQQQRLKHQQRLHQQETAQNAAAPNGM